MELGDALVDELLGLGLGGRDGEVDLAHPGHQRGGMARAVVERLAVDRVPAARERPGWFRWPRRSAWSARLRWKRRAGTSRGLRCRGGRLRSNASRRSALNVRRWASWQVDR